MVKSVGNFLLVTPSPHHQLYIIILEVFERWEQTSGAGAAFWSVRRHLILKKQAGSCLTYSCWLEKPNHRAERSYSSQSAGVVGSPKTFKRSVKPSQNRPSREPVIYCLLLFKTKCYWLPMDKSTSRLSGLSKSPQHFGRPYCNIICCTFW